MPDVRLLTPEEIDDLFRFKKGRAARLARRGELPAIFLPGGDIRFHEDVILRLLEPETNGGGFVRLVGAPAGGAQ